MSTRDLSFRILQFNSEITMFPYLSNVCITRDKIITQTLHKCHNAAALRKKKKNRHCQSNRSNTNIFRSLSSTAADRTNKQADKDPKIPTLSPARDKTHPSPQYIARSNPDPPHRGFELTTSEQIALAKDQPPPRKTGTKLADARYQLYTVPIGDDIYRTTGRSTPCWDVDHSWIIRGTAMYILAAAPNWIPFYACADV